MQRYSTNNEDDNIPKIPSAGEIMFPSHIPPAQRSNANQGQESRTGALFTSLPSTHQPLLGNNFLTHPPKQYHNQQDRGHDHGGTDSPFFCPSTPQPVTFTQTLSTPNGTRVLQMKKQQLILRSKRRHQTDRPENKSNVFGATCNLINCIVGAGIIGIPYAMNQTGILAGIFLIIIVAILTDKSLRILIETGKHVDVQSYEMLMEVVFGGRSGFIFISINMLLMSFGAMVCYLLIIKQTFASIIIENEMIMNLITTVLSRFSNVEVNEQMIGRWFLIISSLIVILPLSTQRDMANLSTTSTISVIFDLLMVLIVAVSSPMKESIENSGGIINVMKDSTVHIGTLFIGLGVLSFAFVCQDSSFIIAGSLLKPTKKRWKSVTRSSLFFCSTLSIVMGVTGYLGFQEATRGNVLSNFLELPRSEMLPFGSIYTYQAINLARTLLGLTMYCVYPMSSYVARHVLIVLLFSGKTAHTGDDHSVLARWDRRIILTLVLYIPALVLALVCNSLGTVLAVTGAVAGSSLSYLGPGVAYLGIHGYTFLRQVQNKWVVKNDWFQKRMWCYHALSHESNRTDQVGDIMQEPGWAGSSMKLLAWYFFLMPLWIKIASAGGKNFEEFQGKQLSKILTSTFQKSAGNGDKTIETGFFNEAVPQSQYGALDGVLMPKNIIENTEKDLHQDLCPPTFGDFVLAILYILFGGVALVAGIFSISSQ